MSNQVSSVERFLAGAVLSVVLAACESPKAAEESSPFAAAPDPKAGPPREVVEKKPWTDAFLKPAVLVAQEVRIEGPEGLIDHVVTPADLQRLEIKVETVEAGLLQTLTVRDGFPEAEIRAQIDNLSIVALKRLTVLERVAHVDVTVHAAGDAYWKETQSKVERRGPVVTLVGPILK